MSQELALERKSASQLMQLGGVAFVAILVAHAVVDGLAQMVPATLGLLELRYHLSTSESAWLLGAGSLFSGLAQPLCALVSDRWSTRQLCIWGFGLGVLGMGAMGLANSFWSAFIIYALGVTGVGMFHPIAAATIGGLWKRHRTTAISIFFMSGMMGGVGGSLIWPRFLSQPYGFEMCPYFVAPLLIIGVVLHRSFAKLEPLHSRENEEDTSEVKSENHWAMVAILYVAAVIRFSVCVALTYLFVRWAESHAALLQPGWSKEAIAEAAAPRVGNLNAMMQLGMACGGLSAGVLIRPGKEKWPLVCVPLLFAIAIGLFPFLPLGAGYLLAMGAGIGFSLMIPVTISLAQKLMPQRTAFASSLMMGGAWAFSIAGSALAEYGLSHFSLQTTFLAVAAAFAISGLVCLPLRTYAESPSPS